MKIKTPRAITGQLPGWLSFERHLVDRGNAAVRETDPDWGFHSALWRESELYDNSNFPDIWGSILSLRTLHTERDRLRGRKVLVWYDEEFDVESFKEYIKSQPHEETKFMTIWSET